MSRAGLRWTQDELAQLRSMREVEGLDYPTIGARLGRDPRSCEVQLSKRRRALSISKKQAQPWSKQEDASLIKAREVEERSWKDVSAIVGRTMLACIARLDHIRAVRKTPNPLAVKVDPSAITSSMAYANALQLRSPAATMMGDPPPGYSALDRKRQGLAP